MRILILAVILPTIAQAVVPNCPPGSFWNAGDAACEPMPDPTPTYPAPTITSVSPKYGQTPGNSHSTIPPYNTSIIEISGTGFRPGMRVKVGGFYATLCLWATPSLTSTLAVVETSPLAWPAGPADVVATNVDGKSGLLAGGFVYIDPVEISSVSRAGGTALGGSVLKVFGKNLTNQVVSFYFDGILAPVAWLSSDGSVAITTPPHGPGAVNVCAYASVSSWCLPVYANPYTYYTPTVPAFRAPSSEFGYKWKLASNTASMALGVGNYWQLQDEVAAVVEAAYTLFGDPKGLLRAGGVVTLYSDQSIVSSSCGYGSGGGIAGCFWKGNIVLLYGGPYTGRSGATYYFGPDLSTYGRPGNTALPHEVGHAIGLIDEVMADQYGVQISNYLHATSLPIGTGGYPLQGVF